MSNLYLDKEPTTHMDCQEHGLVDNVAMTKLGYGTIVMAVLLGGHTGRSKDAGKNTHSTKIG